VISDEGRKGKKERMDRRKEGAEWKNTPKYLSTTKIHGISPPTKLSLDLVQEHWLATHLSARVWASPFSKGFWRNPKVD